MDNDRIGHLAEVYFQGCKRELKTFPTAAMRTDLSSPMNNCLVVYVSIFARSKHLAVVSFHTLGEQTTMPEMRLQDYSVAQDRVKLR